MIDLLRSIVDAISNFVSFITHSIQTFLNILAAIPRFTAYIFNLVNNLIPDVLKPFIIISVVISIVYLIIGRNK